jgi:mono/diheme cytochrome c family protein
MAELCADCSQVIEKIGSVLEGRHPWMLFAGLLLACGTVLSAASPQQSAAAPAQGVSQPRALVNQYCMGCHNEKLKTAGLELSSANVDHIDQNPDVWEKVLRKVRARYMPPYGLPRPDEKTYESFTSYLETSLDRAAAAKPNPGRTETLRRLNRTEYQNAIRDLLSLDVDVTGLLPSDDSSYGFDNITVGGLSPTLLERYLAAAQKISRLAIGGQIRSPGGDTIVVPSDRTQEDHVEGLPFGTRGGTVVHYTFPLNAEYSIQLRLARDRNERVEGLTAPDQLELTLDGQRVQLFKVTPPPSGQDHSGVDRDLNVRIPVKAGPHDIGVAFMKKTSALLETERQPYVAHFNLDRHPRIQPALYSVSIVGPYDANGAGDTPSRRRIFVCHPAKASEEEPCARRILSTFARRAYRRPPTEAEVDMAMKFYKDARTDGAFETGIEMALRALLVSPEFLFQIEQEPANTPPNTVYRLSDLEIASRLSFFLWSSIPDDQLLDLAIAGKLKDPAVLAQQVRRMLADPRSEALVNSFADQWLYLRNLASTIPDSRLFPDFDDNLRESMRRETQLFFESVMREDRNVLDLLNAKYTFVNERLAKHYGIPNVYGSQFRRVSFGDDSVRGGLLSQGSILTVTSYPDRTSPVIRGKWILTNIVGAPPPPPPPNVPPLKENASSGKILTMRERMAQHRANQPCAGCHKLMDPVGFMLENFDAVGRFRTAADGATVDASGNLPDGVSFVGEPGLQKAVMNRPELFVSTTTEKLLTYALGRGLDYYDAPAVRKIVREAHNSDYRFSSLVIGIVNSTPFQMRRSQ